MFRWVRTDGRSYGCMGGCSTDLPGAVSTDVHSDACTDVGVGVVVGVVVLLLLLLVLVVVMVMLFEPAAAEKVGVYQAKNDTAHTRLRE